MEVTCILGHHVFGQEEGPCPALEKSNTGYGCGLVSRPREFAPTRVAIHGAKMMSDDAATLIGAGIGCDAQADGETPSFEFLVAMDAERFFTRTKMMLAAKRWGIVT